MHSIFWMLSTTTAFGSLRCTTSRLELHCHFFFRLNKWIMFVHILYWSSVWVLYVRSLSSRLSWGMIQNIHFNLTLSLVCFWRKTVRATTPVCVFPLSHSLNHNIGIANFLAKHIKWEESIFSSCTRGSRHWSACAHVEFRRWLWVWMLAYVIINSHPSAIQQNPGYKRASRVIIVKFSIHIFKCIHSESTEIVYGHQCWWTGSDGSIITRPFSLAIFASR